MPTVIPNFFNIEKELKAAEDYVSQAILATKAVRPILTFYQQENSILTITFPLDETPEQRLSNFGKVAWVNSCLKTSGVRFVVDSTVVLQNDLGEDYNQDLVIVFFCNKMGCFVHPKCYVFSQDTHSIEWIDKVIDDKSVMDSQPAVINMLAAQFFFSRDVLPWAEYLEYLENNGFNIEYHSGFDKNLLEYAQAVLY